MDIKLLPIGKGASFIFPALPESIKGTYAANYQSFDIISRGVVKVPKGMNVTGFSWQGEFFGPSKRNERIVQTNHWRDPIECVNILTEYMEKEKALTLIVTKTWINADVTIASFQPTPYGAYGNIRYSIEFAIKKDLKIYTTDELKISAYVKKTKARNDSSSEPSPSSDQTYTVASGDTLSKIALKMLGNSSDWTKIYDANTDTIESTAKSHGKANSDHGHWIWPGETLTIP